MKNTLPGFHTPRVEVFLKLGGSILSRFDKCRELAELLSTASRTHRIVLFPGGGPIDKYIESIDKDLHFQPHIHHQLCARAQDQTGLIFGTLCSNAMFFTNPVEIEPILDRGALAIMLPMDQIVGLDVFEQSWRVTSDTMSAYFAFLVSADRFAILTDVDGIFDSLQNTTPGPRPTINASELLSRKATCVDECLPDFLLHYQMPCAVLNGLDCNVVGEWIANDICSGTMILPK